MYVLNMRKKIEMIKAIPTEYAGIKFRSRLEARYAKSFDDQGWKWVYEPETFDLNGTWYIPDFYIPTENSWFEIKGIINEDNIFKTKKFQEMLETEYYGKKFDYYEYIISDVNRLVGESEYEFNVEDRKECIDNAMENWLEDNKFPWVFVADSSGKVITCSNRFKEKSWNIKLPQMQYEFKD